MADEPTEFPTQRVRLQQCNICGRKFNADSLRTHQAICRKVTNKKRRVFDAGKQRAEGSDVPYKATKKTALVYNGEIRPQDDRRGVKSNWREKHKQLIKSIREARSVTQAMNEGGPLPAFRPSEVPSDYVACPYCHRNFNEHAAKRHIPFCQTQHGRKQPPSSRPSQQLDRGRTLPAPNSSSFKQQSSNSSMYSGGPQDGYSNGYKHSNSAPMLMRRNPHDMKQPSLQQPPPPPQPPRKSSPSLWDGFKRFFGFGPKEDPDPSNDNYQYDIEDDYERPNRRAGQKPVLMRTGRTQENTNLNVRARQRVGEASPNVRRGRAPPPAAPPAYSHQRTQYGNDQLKSTRPTAVGRAPPSANRCYDCGASYNSPSARFCPNCGSRR